MLAAMLKENENNKTYTSERYNLLTNRLVGYDNLGHKYIGFDVEHIEAANYEDINLRNQRYAMWKDEINCLGNLVVLERSINRSIQNISFNEKKKVYLIIRCW